VKRIGIDATYTNRAAKLVIDGVEARDGTLHVEATGNPAALADATAKVAATRFDVTPLLAFAPGPVGGTRGTIDADLAIQGLDPRTARVSGDLHIKEARIPLAPTVGALRQANIDIAIGERQITLAAAGKLGAGDVKLDGTIGVDGVNVTGGQAKIVLRKVSPIGVVEPQIDADVTAKIERRAAEWHVDAIVDKGFVKVTKASGEKLKPAGNPDDLVIGGPNRPTSKPGAPPPPAKPAISMTVTIRPMKVESEEFRTTIHGNLDIVADADAVGMKGSIEAQSGDVDLFDRRYRLDRAAASFDGTIDPKLYVRITHDFPDVTTVTVVRGRASAPELALSSDPGNYTQSQLLGFLLGGEPSGDPNSGSARDKAESAGASFIANQIGGYMKQALPFDIDVIRYEAASSTSSAAVTVGTWITHTLFFAFRQHLDARPTENSGEGTLEYWMTRRLEIEATAGDRNYDGLDVLWRKRF
jgi:translocation and assembly module TamB